MTSFLDRLAHLLPDLPSKMSAAATFALDNPDFIAMNSMRAAAKKSGVTSTTMLRLARLMDFESYIEFKQAFQKNIIGVSFGDRAKQLQDSTTSPDIKPVLQGITEAAIKNLNDTLNSYDPNVLQQMAKVLLSARTPYVIGVGSMHSVAELMQFTGRMTLPGLRVPRMGEATIFETLGAIREDDAILALTVAPYAKNSADALKFAKDRGATVMVITDKRSSPMLEFADLQLLTATNSPHYYPSFIAIVAVIEALLATTVIEGGQDVLDQIAMIDQIREKSGVYL
jgi:DNA-binding MurR/RpiR family transcriptional regulator